MKFYKSLILMCILVLMLGGCVPPVELPDLVITEIETTGSPFFREDDNVTVPVRVTVKNQGNADAGTFKVSLHYTGSQGTFGVAFQVEGQSQLWYPYTTASLSPGNEVTFEGDALFIIRGETVSLKALADSCSGDEFMPDYCRVDESNEMNNESEAITVVLP